MTTTPTTTPRLARRVALASSFGTMLEFYDFYLYGALAATIFGKLFFHASDPAVGTLLALATFGVGFIARPVGGVIAGHFGDRVGRKKVLIATLTLMGAATIGIGLLPTYASIGVAAPMLLVSLRFIQGLAHGGEWGGAVIMTVEHAPDGRRGFYGSLPQMGVYAGIVLANLVLGAFLLLPAEQFEAWGWRVPFLLGFVLVLVGLYLRRSITESPEFAAVLASATEPPKVPLWEALRTSKKSIFVTFSAKAAETCAFYLITVFSLTLATAIGPDGRSIALNAVLVAAAIAAVTVAGFGALADRFGRWQVYLAGVLFVMVFAVPFFFLVGSGSVTGLFIALIVGLAVGHSAMYGAQSVYFSELFDPRVRYTGASLGYQLGAALVGGFTPLIAAWLILEADGQSWPVVIYISVICVFSAAVIVIFGRVKNNTPAKRAEEHSYTAV